jgi:hypothetical protein
MGSLRPAPHKTMTARQVTLTSKLLRSCTQSKCRQSRHDTSCGNHRRCWLPQCPGCNLQQSITTQWQPCAQLQGMAH